MRRSGNWRNEEPSPSRCSESFREELIGGYLSCSRSLIEGNNSHHSNSILDLPGCAVRPSGNNQAVVTPRVCASPSKHHADGWGSGDRAVGATRQRARKP